MKKISYSIIALVASAMTLSLASCSDDYDYQPGTAVAADCPNVYFSNNNESLIEVKSDDASKKVSLELHRANTKGSVTVPIVVDSKTDNITVPESVTFADGDSTAYLDITYSEFSIGTKFTVSIADDYVNPYSMVDGFSTFSATLTQVNKVCDVMYATDSRFAGVTNSAIYNYSGENRFIFTNFLGSGVDLKFRVDTNVSGATFDMNDITKLSGDIIPLNYYTKDDYGFHFVNTSGSEDYVTWTPEGASEAVTSFYFYDVYNGYSYSFIDFGSSAYGMFYSAYVNQSSYENIYFYLYY